MKFVITIVLLFLLSAPIAAAQYTVTATMDAPYANIGQGVTATLAVEDEDGNKIPQAEVQVRRVSGTQHRVTGADGELTMAMYHGADPGVETVLAKVTGVFDGGTRAPATSPEISWDMIWTALVIDLSVPDETYKAGDGAPFLAHLSWAHDGSPVDGVRVRFVGPSSQYAITDASGNAQIHFTKNWAGELTVMAGVDDADLPWGIWMEAPGEATALFDGPNPPNGNATAENATAGGQWGAKGEGGGGNGGQGSSSTTTSTQTSGPNSSDDEAASSEEPGQTYCADATGLDSDGDGIDDGCDTDRDNDGVPDVHDAFPGNANDSSDSDGDGRGDSWQQIAPKPAVVVAPEEARKPTENTQDRTTKDAPGLLLPSIVVGLACIAWRLRREQ